MTIDVKNLIQAKDDSATVAYQSFVLLSNSNKNDLFCFFENKDAPYYHNRIKQNYNGDYHYIKCGNKSFVKKVFNLIGEHAEYKKYKKAFFIDRDFDASIKDKYKEIYETPCYSIENLYCSVKCLQDLLKADFQIGADLPEYKKILKLYEKLKNEFLEKSLLFNAWYKLQKEKSECTKVSNNVSLSESLIPKYIEMSLTSLNVVYTLETLAANFPAAFTVNNKEVSKKMNELRKMDLSLSLRGKYLFSFMKNFIRLLVEDSSSPKKMTILKKKVKYNMDSSMALTLLTVHADTPECLIDFLKRYN